MANRVILPKQGLQMTEGVVTKWLVSEGDLCYKGQPLFEMETDKLTITVDAPESGILLKILRGELETVPVAETVAIIGEPGEDISGLLSGADMAAVVNSDAAADTISKAAAEDTTSESAAIPDAAADTISKATASSDAAADVASWAARATNSGTTEVACSEAARAKFLGATVAEHAAIPGPKEHIATPRARALASENNVDIDVISGAGPGGRVVERDVRAYLERVKTGAGSGGAGRYNTGRNGAGRDGSGDRADNNVPHDRTGYGDRAGNNVPHDRTGYGDRADHAGQNDHAGHGDRAEEFIPVSRMRGIISERMLDSLRTMAQANHTITVDMSAASDIRERSKRENRKLSYNDIFLFCTAKALTSYPMMNASLSRNGISVKKYVNLGMAVSVEGGLLVPVIKGADLMNLAQISGAAADLNRRAKENKLLPDELSGGTFTVSNLGMFGLDSFTAIINPPEAGILAVGEVQKRTIVISDAIAIRPLAQLCLTYDHRIVDGALAARFLREVKRLLENMS